MTGGVELFIAVAGRPGVGLIVDGLYDVNTDGWLTAAGRTDSMDPNDAGHQAMAAKLAPIVAAALNS